MPVDAAFPVAEHGLQHGQALLDHLGADPVTGDHGHVQRLRAHAGHGSPAVPPAGTVVPSGLSNPRSHLESPRLVEGYVHRDDLAGVMADHWLSPAGRFDADAVLHVVVDGLPDAPVPDLLVTVDLADWGGPREVGRGRELLEPLVELWAGRR